MKISLKQFSKSTLSVVLAFCLLFSCATVGLVATDAAQVEGESVGYSSMNGRIYYDNTLTNWSNVYLYVGKSDYAKSYTMTSTGYHNIWYMDFSDSFTDRTKLYFADHNDSQNGQNFSIDTHYGWNADNSTRTALTTANDSDANSLFTPASASAGTLTRSYPRVVAGDLSSNSWDDCTDIMTYSSSQWTKTYNNVSAGNYSLAVVGFYNNWSPSYRWSAKGTLTANGLGSWADANDGDHNIKLTLTGKANVTITLTSSNKVNISLTSAETMYTITVATDSQGSLSSTASLSAGANTAANLPTATPKYGYKFKNWTATTGLTLTNATSASGATVKATQAGTVTAHYEVDTSLNLYIAGRFRVHPSSGSSAWTYSYDSGDWSNTGDDNIKLTYDSGTAKYKVETYASLADLSSKISNFDPYFFVYDKDNAKGWHTTANTNLTDSNQSAVLTTNDATYNVRFNSSSNDTPVVL